MSRHKDFKKIHDRFTKQYGERKGDLLYSSWIEKKEYDDTKSFPKGKEKKEKRCSVVGFEIKENDKEYHVEGLIATSHIDSLDEIDGIDIPDIIPKITLDSFASQMNSLKEARVMGVHHSEGNPVNPEYFGETDVINNPAKVIRLSDGEWGLFADTKLLKSDPITPSVINRFEDSSHEDHLNGFSITYDTNNFLTTDFDWIDGKLVRVLNPDTKLFGYTAGNDLVNKNAKATNYGFKEFKELVSNKEKNKEVIKMTDEEKTKLEAEAKAKEEAEAKVKEEAEAKAKEEADAKAKADAEAEGKSTEEKEFLKYKAEKKTLEEKEILEKAATKIADGVLSKMEIKEKVLKGKAKDDDAKVSFEVKEFRKLIEKPSTLEIKEQFRVAAAACDSVGIDWQSATTEPAEKREFKTFGVNGRNLEYKSLGLTTNQNTDTDYLQSTAELQDVYDPIIYNALNQETLTWNVLAKDDFSKKGNNHIQFVLKIAANSSATFYTGNGVASDNVTRLKYQTKFKKIQVGVSVDGDMIAAARGGPVNDVFAQEVMDSTMDMLEVMNAALYAKVGAETAAGVIGFEYIADSASNTSLYYQTRSATNKLAPDAAGDTYIDGGSSAISMSNLRKMKRQATTEGAKKRNLVFFTSPTQGDLLRAKFDDQRRLYTDKDSKFGFSTDLFVDGIPIFEDIDCNSDDWFCVDLESHRVGIWVPPTIERLGKSADSEDAFVKSYFGVYNRRPRALSMCYGNSTS